MSHEDAAFEAYLDQPSRVLTPESVDILNEGPSVHKFIEGLIEGKTKTRAALDAGYSNNTASRAKELIQSTKAYKDALKELWPEEYLHQKMFEGLHANKIVKQNGVEKEVPDHAIRYKYLELGFKLSGKIKGGTEEPEDDDNLKYTKSTNVNWESKLPKAKVKEVIEGEIIDGNDRSTV